MTDFGGIKIPVSGRSEVRTASALPGVIDATLMVGTLIQGGSKSHEWNAVFSIQNYSASGDNCAFYSKADKYSDGPTWGGCVEVQDTTGRGAVWGLEVDVMTRPDNGGGDRYGVGVVIGRNGNAGPTAYVDRGISVMPFGFDFKSAHCGVGLDVNIDCIGPAIRVRSDNDVQWDTGGEVRTRFDSETGFWQLRFRDKPVFEVQVETGEMRILGRTVRVA
jgi:hypothetical protein